MQRRAVGQVAQVDLEEPDRPSACSPSPGRAGRPGGARGAPPRASPAAPRAAGARRPGPRTRRPAIPPAARAGNPRGRHGRRRAPRRGRPRPPGRCPRRRAPRSLRSRSSSRNSPRPQPRSTTGARPAKSVHVAGQALAQVLARAAESVLEGHVVRVVGGAGGRGRGGRRAAARPRPARSRIALISSETDLHPIAQGEQPFQPAAERFLPAVEGLEHQLRARGGEGGGDAVARVHHGQDVLEVLHERRGHLGQARVQAGRLLEVAVEDLDERGVELGLALEDGREQLPALAVRAAGEAAALPAGRAAPRAG